MANQKIHEYPLERFVYGDDDYYDIDYWDGAVYQTAKILGSTIKAAMLSGIAISLTAPAAFIVGGSPVDGTGTLTLTAAGLANQYIRGDGTLATFPTSGGGGNNVNYYLNGGTAASVATYYQMSKTAVIGTGVDFSLAGNGLISQWLTDVSDPNVTEIPAGNWNFEMFFSASSSGGTPEFYIEILKYDGSTFTTISDNSLVPEPITSGTAIDLYLSSLPMPLTTMLTTDRIAIRVYIVNSVMGRTITHHTQNSHLCQVITTFSSGLSSINGLTEQTQYLAVGTAGTDFAINSVTDTHTFNLPTASATKRGALSSANWSTFNGKQNPITLTTTGTGAATFIADTLNIPIASGGTPAGITGQIQFNNGGAFGADSGLFWDNTNKRLGIGATPASTVRLDVRAQGALSTDIAFRVRNSADTIDIFSINGDGILYKPHSSPNDDTAINIFISQMADGRNKIRLFTKGGYNISASVGISFQNDAGGTQISSYTLAGASILNNNSYKDNSNLSIFHVGGTNVTQYSYLQLKNYNNTNTNVYISRTGTIILNPDNVNGQIRGLSLFGGTLGATADRVIAVGNGTAPTTSTADNFQMYSNDIAAGNAAPHFRTENGSIVKLYQETTAIAAATLVSNLGTPITDTDTFDGYTLKQIVKALRNQGLLT